MLHNVLPEHNHEQKNTRQSKRKSSRLFFVIGLLLLLNICYAGAVSPSPSLNGSSSSVIQTLDITTILPTQTQDIVAALTAQPTIALPPASAAMTTASGAAQPTIATDAINTPALTETPGVNAGSLMRTGAAGIDQYTIRAGKRVSQAEKDAAAADYKKIREAYLKTGIPSLQGPGGIRIAAAFNTSVTPAMDPGGIPHYFGPYPNWVNSPMPMGNISNISVENGGTGYTAPVVTIADVYFTGSGATATATVVGGIITNITVTNGGTNYTAPVVIIADPSPIAADASATAILGGPFKSGIRKFVDTLPGLNVAGMNNLGQYIPIAQKDTTTFTTPPSDYYELALVQFTEKMHSDLPETTFRGYVQLETSTITGDHYPLNYPDGTNITNALGNPVYAVHKPHYLGPIIVANNGTPVRVKFYNYLPIGSEGNLFIPVDTTVMGAGMGPQGMNTSPIYYTQNRAELHLHGGATPWISDGTPYQWITPANEYTTYPKGVSVYDVPDMPSPGNGSQTYFYTNQQSARLMFYHDHAHGITRLNVYAGEAAGYLVTDQQEQDMIAGTDVTGINTGINAAVLPDIGIPLVIQDRTWVDANTIASQDPTWNWGTDPGAPRTGDLWYPHVYMPAQNPFDDTGVNAYGRWHYGPWFFPPTDTPFGPVANPYFGNINFTGEPPQMPGTPNPSAVGEAFMDTPIVNGAAYPNMTVDPRAYRFRILNAADDRALNLQLYVADANVTTADGRNNTEVRMVPAVTTPGFPADWPTDNREGGVPDPATRGPPFIQIGTEGGFLPAPVVVQNQPITWVNDPTRFDFGNVDKHALVLMGAERADVIVDFSGYAGKTLILYNDAPAAYPAGVNQYNYYTGDPDRTDTGGAPTTQPGYGPNIRTIMQIKVNNTAPAAPYNVATLNAVFAKTATKLGVFESSQPPIIVPQVAYGSAYNRVFTENNFARIADSYKNFTALSGVQFNISFQPKALHDEMGGVYDQYGRMSGMLGLEVPSRTATTAQFFPYPYASPPTDILMTSVGEMAGPQPGDGTQIWRLSHNGVDSHPIHWHMYNVQVINRVGWDGFIRAPDPTELGWKDTLRVSPLEDTIVALRPVAVTVPFAVPDQVRAIEPIKPLGEPLDTPPGGLWFSQSGNPVIMPNGLEGIQNHLVNYGWEYVWHCHILAHEEMDMMHSQAVSVNNPGTAPDTLRSNEVYNATTNTIAVYLRWIDRSNQETDWIIQRTNVSQTNWTDFKTVQSYSKAQAPVFVMAIDNSIPAGTIPNYSYRVMAANVVGDDYAYNEQVDPGELPGFPHVFRNSTVSNTNISLATALPGPVTFGASPNSGNVPLNVSFTGTSAGATGWSWDFGDGNFADDNGKQNPNHVYELPGTYTVTLTAMTLAGNATSTQITTITVNAVPPPAAPIASFSAVPTSGIAPLTVTFSDTSTSNPTVWATRRWSFGDGTFSSLQTVNHTYTTGGNFTVFLTATNLGGTSVASTSINVTAVAPIANFSAAPTSGSAPLTVAFTDLSTNGPTAWNWTFGDGTTATIRNPVHVYTTAGVYDVSLNASNSGGFGIFTRPAYINVSTAAPFSVGVYRQSAHMFYLKNGTGPTIAINWGISTDLPVTGDWNGDRITDVGVYRPSSHMFYLKNGTGPTTAINWGISTDLPVTGDWNGDGVTDIGIYRPSAHTFYLKNGTALSWTTIVVNWGISTDLPVTGKWS